MISKSLLYFNHQSCICHFFFNYTQRFEHLPFGILLSDANEEFFPFHSNNTHERKTNRKMRQMVRCLLLVAFPFFHAKYVHYLILNLHLFIVIVSSIFQVFKLLIYFLFYLKFQCLIFTICISVLNADWSFFSIYNFDY